MIKTMHVGSSSSSISFDVELDLAQEEPHTSETMYMK